MLLCLLLWTGLASGEALSPEGWRTLVRDAQRHVAEGTPRSLVAMRRLADRQVRDVDGGVVVVDDRELLRLISQLELAMQAPELPTPAYREAALYLALLEGEVDALLEEPPPPYSQAIRPDGTLFATATRPLQPARAGSSWTQIVQTSWGRVRAWVGIALSGRGPGGTGVTAVVLVGTSLAALLLALWPLFRSLLTRRERPVPDRSLGPGGHHSPLGQRLLAILDQLGRRGLLTRPAHLTNGEVLDALPASERGLLAPAVRVHDAACYGAGPSGEAEHALLEQVQRRMERQP